MYCMLWSCPHKYLKTKNCWKENDRARKLRRLFYKCGICLGMLILCFVDMLLLLSRVHLVCHTIHWVLARWNSKSLKLRAWHTGSVYVSCCLPSSCATGCATPALGLQHRPWPSASSSWCSTLWWLTVNVCVCQLEFSCISGHHLFEKWKTWTSLEICE